MKKFNITVAICSLLAIGFSLYLSAHYYQIHTATLSGPVSCNINSLLDCSAVSASPFSNIFGIPISAFGLSLYIILAISLWMSMFSKKSTLWFYTGFVTAAIGAMASLVMGVLSFMFLKVYCLYCIALYILSFIIFLSYCINKKTKKIKWSEWSQGQVLLSIASIPILALVIHSFYLKSYKRADLSKIAKIAAQDWSNSPQVIFEHPPLLSFGSSAQNATMTIVEFADFLCPHCQKAVAPLKAFAKIHDSVRVEFYPFPLDGYCNPQIPAQRSQTPCLLALAVICAQEQKQGWKIHDFIFENQKKLSKDMTSADLENELNEAFGTLNKKQWASCLSQPETKESLDKLVSVGVKAQITGTPTIFVNNKKLEYGQYISTLEKIKKQIQKK